MARHKAVCIGAGRIGAGWNWKDDAYTHAGAYMALKGRVELIGFVEPNQERAEAACLKWKVPALKSLDQFDGYDIVSVCVQPDDQLFATGLCIDRAAFIKGMWCEKPFMRGPIKMPFPTQVNYLRRADPWHRSMALQEFDFEKLIVYGKDDEATRCHFEDLSRWWKVPLDYRPFNGPCAYILETANGNYWLDNGGLDNPGNCMQLMLANLLATIDGKDELWSPPYVE